jgi:hypothetical protein
LRFVLRPPQWLSDDQAGCKAIAAGAMQRLAVIPGSAMLKDLEAPLDFYSGALGVYLPPTRRGTSHDSYGETCHWSLARQIVLVTFTEPAARSLEVRFVLKPVTSSGDQRAVCGLRNRPDE